MTEFHEPLDIMELPHPIPDTHPRLSASRVTPLFSSSGEGRRLGVGLSFWNTDVLIPEPGFGRHKFFHQLDTCRLLQNFHR